MSWPQVKLQDVCSLLTDGTHYTPPNLGEGVPFLTVKDMTQDGLNFKSCSLISHEEYVRADDGNSAPKLGDVLFSKDGTVGKVHVVCEAKDFAVLSSIAILRPKKDQLDANYLGHVLRSEITLRQATKNKTGSALRRIILKDIKNLLIPLPPLPEQKRIAAILDKADQLRQKRQQAIGLADEFLRSVFLDMFGDPVTNPKGWERRSLKSVSLRFSDGPFGSKLKSEHYVENGVRVVRLQNIGVGVFKNDVSAFISEDYFESTLSKFLCSPGDIVIGTMGEPNVRACLVPDFIGPAINKADCVQCAPNENIVLKEYLVALLNLPQFLHFFTGLIHGQTRTRVSSGQLGKVEIPIPDLAIQRKFAEFTNISAQKISRVHESIQQMNMLFNSLSQKAFAGEL